MAMGSATHLGRPGDLAGSERLKRSEVSGASQMRGAWRAEALSKLSDRMKVLIILIVNGH